MLSQEEINALLGGGLAAPQNEEQRNGGAKEPEDLDLLSSYQKDILGEIGNISMGTSATTLFALLGQRVEITTPRVKTLKWKTLSAGYDKPCVGIRVDYKEGIEGSNVLILKESDVKIITSLMLGGDGTQDIDQPITELDLSAIGEAMNQMVGSASTSLSSLIKMRIDIDTPTAFVLDFNNENDFLANTSFSEEAVCCINFKMQIGELIDSEIMQMIPLNFAEDMISIMESELMGGQTKVVPEKTPIPEATASAMANAPMPHQIAGASPQQYATQEQVPPPQLRPEPQPVAAQVPRPVQSINAQPVQFTSFDAQDLQRQKENIGIIMDVPLEVTVELGRTSKKIKEILEFTPGTIVELDRLAGEPIDVMVNGKFVARGEVVVIDENFGIRITDIVNVEQRI